MSSSTPVANNSTNFGSVGFNASSQPKEEIKESEVTKVATASFFSSPNSVDNSEVNPNKARKWEKELEKANSDLQNLINLPKDSNQEVTEELRQNILTFIPKLLKMIKKYDKKGERLPKEEHSFLRNCVEHKKTIDPSGKKLI
mgnify:CR=1 FL=1